MTPPDEQGGAASRFLDYAPAPESTSVLHLRETYGLFIDGDWVINPNGTVSAG